MRFTARRRLLSILAAVSVLGIVGLESAARAQDAVPSTPLIVVTGDANVRRSPDVAFLTLSVESHAGNPREATRQSADKNAAVQRALATAGIPRDAIKTVGAWLEEEFDNVQGRRVSRGYVARATIEIRVEEVARAGEIADSAVQAGATGLNGVRFDLKDRAAAEREALQQAVENARERADAAARGAGRTVDRILRIEDEHAETGVRPVMFMRAEAERSATTTFEPGMLDISARVKLTASMK